MKKDTHPEYVTEAKVICACGNIFVTGSVKKELKTELCSSCHPFFTGKQKLVDTERRAEKFQAKVAAKTAIKSRGKKVKRAAKAEARSLKDSEK